jgi:hypothetical protein
MGAGRGAGPRHGSGALNLEHRDLSHPPQVVSCRARFFRGIGLIVAADGNGSGDFIVRRANGLNHRAVQGTEDHPGV